MLKVYPQLIMNYMLATAWELSTRKGHFFGSGPKQPLLNDTPSARQQASETTAQVDGILQQRQARFSTYLMSRGMLTSSDRSDALLGVIMARRQGQAEAGNCNKQLDGCLATRNADEKANRTDGSQSFSEWKQRDDKSWEAFQACGRDAPACERMRRCANPDGLPF
jgi:hypothetical protein